MRMNSAKHRKTRHQTAIPVNITLPPVLHGKLLILVQSHGFTGPSDYFQARIRSDAGLDLAHEEARQPHAA